jgi:hypothetical protein
MCEVSGIGFSDLKNTRSIAAGSLTLHFWNELSGRTTLTLTQPLSVDSDEMWISDAASLFVGSALQVEGEIVVVNEISQEECRLKVQRGAFGTAASAHDDGNWVWHLQRKRFVLPFVRGVFGTPAAGSYSQMLMVPDIRIAAAELYVTNAKGNSQAGFTTYTELVDGGIRTLSGGQFSMQISGALSIQSDAVPRLSIESTHAVRDLFASVLEPATGSPIEIRVTRNGEPYALLTIPPGETLSDPILDGLTLPPLNAGWALGLDVIGVGIDRPGAGLTVTVRL